MSSEPNSRLAPLILVKIVCCGGLVLVATGALSGVGTWLLDGGLIWLALAGLALVAWLALRGRRRVQVGWYENSCARSPVSEERVQPLDKSSKVSKGEPPSLQDLGWK